MDLTFASVHITHTNDVKNVKSTTWCKAVILQTMYNQNLLFGCLSQCIAHQNVHVNRTCTYMVHAFPTLFELPIKSNLV